MQHLIPLSYIPTNTFIQEQNLLEQVPYNLRIVSVI